MSVNYVPDPSGRVATFSELAQSSTESAQLVSSIDNNSRPEPVAPDAVMDPRLSYALTDGSNYLWLYFSQDGVMTSADRFGIGGNNVDELLNHVADTMVGEHDDGYWDLVDPDHRMRNDDPEFRAPPGPSQAEDLVGALLGHPGDRQRSPVQEDDSALPAPAGAVPAPPWLKTRQAAKKKKAKKAQESKSSINRLLGL